MYHSTPRKTAVLLAASASLAIAVVVLIALPAALYSGNRDEFTAPFFPLVRTYLLLGLPVFLLGVVPACFLPLRAATAWSAAWAVIALYAWLYGNFVVYDLGTLDGQTWSLKMPAWIIWLELACILLVLIAAFLAARAKPSLLAMILALLAIGGLGSAWPALSDGARTNPAEAEEAGANAAFAFSKSKNLLVILLDAMQSDIFEDIVDENPALKSALKGFTFYPDTAGVAPTTILSIPAIHSGMEYDPSLSTDAYYDAAVHKGSFLNDLARKGYRSILVNPIRGICPSEAMCTSATAMLGGARASVREEAAHLLDIALLRLSPLMLKPLVYNDGKWRIALLTRDERLLHPATKSNAVLAELAEKLAPGSDRPTATFLHLFSTHLPVVLNDRCQFVGETIPKTRDSYKVQVRCGLMALQLVLDALHRADLYDRTAIVLLSDHGTSGMRNARAIPSPSGMNSPTMLGIANPTFAFKPFDANEPFHATGAAISIADVPGIVCGGIGDCLRPQRPPGRERGFNYYAWKGEYASLPRIPNIVPYGITGSPMWAGSAWRRLDTE